MSDAAKLIERAAASPGNTAGKDVPTPTQAPTPIAAPPASAPPTAPTAPASQTRERWRNPEFDEERTELRAEMDEMMREARDPFYDAEAQRRVDREIADGRRRLGLKRKGG